MCLTFLQKVTETTLSETRSSMTTVNAWNQASCPKSQSASSRAAIYSQFSKKFQTDFIYRSPRWHEPVNKHFSPRKRFFFTPFCHLSLPKRDCPEKRKLAPKSKSSLAPEISPFQGRSRHSDRSATPKYSRPSRPRRDKKSTRHPPIFRCKMQETAGHLRLGNPCGRYTVYQDRTATRT